MAILMPDPRFFNVDANGGPLLLGFISAVAFATILAVVAGLTLAGASAVSHDIYGQVMRRGRASEIVEVRIAKIAAVVIGLAAVGLAYAFENQNVAFMAGLALSVAASCNFPVLAMAIFWRGTTTRGAVFGGLVGLFVSVLLVVVSKTVWVAVFHFGAPLFPYDNPALFSMPLAFLSIWLGSRSDLSVRGAAERRAFDAQFVQSETGIRGLVENDILAGASQ